MIGKEQIAGVYRKIQDEICLGLEAIDGTAAFEEEQWNRIGGGGGRSRIIQNGNILEKGGVNFSEVYGKLPEQIKKSFGVTEDDFFATGVSIVIHPNHPLVPIIHMNIRYFELNDEIRWFGGGIDLTPHYVDVEDAIYFHTHLKAVCDSFSNDFYLHFKSWADDYFFIRHRKETRGIGGIFYDRLTEEKAGIHMDDIFAFSVALGRLFVPLYGELVNRHRHKPYSDQQKQWQFLRRSRYVEFNLVYDAGTRFGLETDGRTESILMSMPPQANWAYNYLPETNSDEAKTLSLLRKGIDWL
ncbi:coproporphyrinogen oxidase [bacterium A37T11]|nr:coproporphyrinogen oxidase [bacterium A37T11]